MTFDEAASLLTDFEIGTKEYRKARKIWDAALEEAAEICEQNSAQGCSWCNEHCHEEDASIIRQKKAQT